MANIIPDEIRDIDGTDIPSKIHTIYHYIIYMREQIEFWGSNRSKEIAATDGWKEAVKGLSDALDQLENTVGTLSDDITALQEDAEDIHDAIDALNELQIYDTYNRKIWPQT